MISKINSHKREIEFIKSILPITKLILETGKFDPHLLKDQTVRFQKWKYLKGDLYGYENVKSFVLDRDEHQCKHCKKKNTRLEVHHIHFRSKGGSDEPENLITLCHKCHYDVHHNGLDLKLKGKPKSALNHATQMNSIRIQLLKMYPEAIETFGFITKINRYESGLFKDHNFDACVIATQSPKVKFKTKICYLKKHIAKGDYQKTKGVRSEKDMPKTKILGFKRFDKVRYLGKEYFIQGRMPTGYAVLMGIDGDKIDFSNAPKGFKTPKLKNLKRISARKTTLVDKEIIGII